VLTVFRLPFYMYSTRVVSALCRAPFYLCVYCLCRPPFNPFYLCVYCLCRPPFYLYINSLSNKELVVDVRKADRKPGAKVIVYANKGDLADNQLWYEDENSILRSKLNGFACDASGEYC